MRCRLLITLLFILFFANSSANCNLVKPIDAQKNAQMHNSKGVIHMKEKDYLAAVKEFKIAIAINPRKQSTAVYYNNLGCAYLEIARIQGNHGITKNNDFAAWAQDSFENAIAQDCMNLTYYQNLVESFNVQKTLSKNLMKYKKSKKPYDVVVVGLIYNKIGQKTTAKTIFDDFTVENPDLIISKSLKLVY